ncbi:MAG: DUF3106 domain-containing protein [Rugosibacter sp.]|nr:MAG: DUF3106 domain-containing protein [Rugosibacter sp.]
MAQTFRRLILAITLALASIPGYSLDSLNTQNTQPTWSELNSQQRVILTPFSSSWNNMDNYSRKKWLAIAKRYPSMETEEKVRTQNHMKEWVKLTPEERKRAREKYKSLKRSSPNQKTTLKNKWQEYQALPESEKNRLKSAAKHQDKTRPVPKSSALSLKKKAFSHPTRPLTSPPHFVATP